MPNVPRLISGLYSCQNMAPKNMIAGNIPKSKAIYSKMFKLAIPSTIETVLVALITMADTIMVGVLGSASIAAVGITGQPRFLFLAVIMSLNIGVTAIVARRKGEENLASARSTLKQAVMISTSASLALSILGFFSAYPLLRFAGAGPDIIDRSVSYFRIMMIGIPMTSLSLTINAAQRGSGNTRISMRTNLTANLVNVVFNYLLISGNLGFPRLEVRGAAIATVMGNGVALIMSVLSVSRKSSDMFIFSHSDWRFDKKTIRGFVNIGGSSLVEQLIMRFGFFMFVKVVASLGTLSLSTHQICMNIVMLSLSFSEGLSIAASALIGQNLGAKRPDMAIIYGKVCQRVAFSASFILSLFFVTQRRGLVRLFTRETDIIDLGSGILIIISVLVFVQMSQLVISGALRGAGDAKYVALVSLVTVGIIRPAFAYIFAFPLNLGLQGVWCAFVFDQSVRLFFNYTRFSAGHWVKIQI